MKKKLSEHLTIWYGITKEFAQATLKKPLGTAMSVATLALSIAVGLADQTVNTEASNVYFPAEHTITSADGRSLDVTIVGRTETGIKAIRQSDGKEFEIAFDKLSTKDQDFVNSITVKKIKVLLIEKQRNTDPDNLRNSDLHPLNYLTKDKFEVTLVTDPETQMDLSNPEKFLAGFDAIWHPRQLN